MTPIEQAFATAVAHHQAGQLDAAEQAYRALLQHDPKHAGSLCNLGVILVRKGQLDQAVACYEQALKSSPHLPDARFNLGNIYRRAGQLARAAEQYQACLAIDPRHASSHYNLGLVFAALNDLSAAEKCFCNVIALEPMNAEAFMRLGDTFLRTGRISEAQHAFQRAVELKPQEPRGYYNLALALNAQGEAVQAEQTIRQAIALQPQYAEAYNALGLCLEPQGRKDEALANYQTALELKPDLADAWSNLGTSLVEQGRADDAIASLRESLARRPQAPPVHSNLLLYMNYSSHVSDVEIIQEHRRWAERFAGPTPDRPPVPLPHDPDRPLRIGYLSGDFRDHTVARLIEPLLRYHDRKQCRVIAYANVHRPDSTTEKLRSLADEWRAIAVLSDEQVARQIREDQVDLLVDLSGHTAGNRMLVLALRPAPVQITLFGYPNTTGLEAVDFRISDPMSDPISTVASGPEQLLRLPATAWVYSPPSDVPPVVSQREANFTFGCLNNAAKISDACLEAWSQILQETANTRLILLGGQSQLGIKRLRESFVSAGVSADRIEILPRLPRLEYFAAYQRLDLSLDPFPYNGGITTGDSLLMGVPVLTMAGESYRARQGLMTMTTVGLPEFVATSPRDLIEKAKYWIDRRDELKELKATLRQRFLDSPLCDERGYVRALETAYRNVWRDCLSR